MISSHIPLKGVSNQNIHTGELSALKKQYIVYSWSQSMKVGHTVYVGLEEFMSALHLRRSAVTPPTVLNNAEKTKIALKSHRRCMYNLQKSRGRKGNSTTTNTDVGLSRPFFKGSTLANYGFQVVNFKQRPVITPNNQFMDLRDFGFHVWEEVS